MYPLSLNTIIRPVLTLGALVQRHEVVPGRRIWIKDIDGRYLYGNAAMQADGGGALLGKIDADLPWADRAIEYAAADAEALMAPVIIREEYVRDATGRDRRVITHKSALVGARGELIGTLGIFDLAAEACGAARLGERRCRECATAMAAEVRWLLEQGQPLVNRPVPVRE